MPYDQYCTWIATLSWIHSCLKYLHKRSEIPVPTQNSGKKTRPKY